MWARVRKSKLFNKDGKQMREACKNLNVNEEYLSAFRTKSFANFVTKAETLVKEPISPSYCHHKFSDILLEPRQEAIASILESTTTKSDLNALFFNYFNISAEASKICSHLLKSINQVKSNYRFIQQVLDTVDCHSDSPDQQFEFIISEFNSFIILKNPFSNLNQKDFKLVHEKYSKVLNHLKAKRKKVARKIKLINCFNKTCGICVTAACGLVAITAMVLAAHTITALILAGPAILGFPVKLLKKKLLNLRFLRSGFLQKIGKQLDVAAKGTYILNRDFDMISRLVGRIDDEIEHSKGMIQCCLERREDKFSWQLLKELKRGDVGFRKNVEELEEHVYLCLVTINRARALVIKEIETSCVKD